MFRCVTLVLALALAAQLFIELPMSRKQENIVIHANSEDQWDAISQKPCLLAKWAGPCEALTATFRKMKLDHGDKVDFVQALADNIKQFDKFRNTSVPQFLFFIRKTLVGYVKGANAPLIEKVIKDKLDLEARGVEQMPWEPDGEDFASMSSAASKVMQEDTLEKTLAIIKPDAMIPSVIEQIMSTLKWHRFNILEEKKLWFTKEDAEHFYEEHKGRPFFGPLVEFLSSAPIIALKLSKENAVNALREVLGPTNPNRAKDEAPKSLRARFGTDNMINAIYGADSIENAKKHMDFIDTLPGLPYKAVESSSAPQKTVVIIKPGVYPDEIVKRLMWHHYVISKRDEMVLSREQALLLYERHEERSYFEDLIEYVTSGPCTFLVIKGENVCAGVNELAGPHDPQEARKTVPMSFRALYGENSIHNGIDVSETPDEAINQIQVLFPGYSTRVSSVAEMRPKTSRPGAETTLALIKPDAYGSGKRDEIIETIKKNGFTILMQKEFQFTKKQAEQFYIEHAGKAFYETLTTWMSSAPIYGMALKKENAIKDWRDLAGPTNSELARQVAPESIRAKYGTDGSHNAVHGSDSQESAAREIGIVFTEQTLALIKPDAYGSGKKEEIIKRIKDEGFSIVMQKEIHMSVPVAKEFYKEHEGKVFFDDLINYMSSAPIYAMVLEKIDGVRLWRILVGPTNSETARKEAPSSLRALYGKDGTQNAVYGSDSLAAATREIDMIFKTELNAAATGAAATQETSPIAKSRTQSAAKMRSQSNLPGSTSRPQSSKAQTKSPSKNNLASVSKTNLGGSQPLGSAKKETVASRAASKANLSRNELDKGVEKTKTASRASLSKVASPARASATLGSQNKLASSTTKLAASSTSKLSPSKTASRASLAKGTSQAASRVSLAKGTSQANVAKASNPDLVKTSSQPNVAAPAEPTPAPNPN